MQAFLQQSVPVVVQQHAEDAAMLREIRSTLVRAPHVKLLHLKRHDERIAAHLDGLSIAGAYGAKLCAQALEKPGAGAVFAAAHCAIGLRDDKDLDRLFALAGTLPDAKRGLLSAFGWVSASQLQGIAKSLLESDDPLRREIGIGACRLHRVDPGSVLAASVMDTSPSLRAASLRAAGVLGRVDLFGEVLTALNDEDADGQYRAAESACLLGDRDKSLAALEVAAWTDGPHALASLMLAVQAARFDRAQSLVRSLAKADAQSPASERRLIRVVGTHGDTRFVPWLIERMADDRLARLVGEAFSFITGADLAGLDLERKPPEGIESGPNDDPHDDSVAMDEDDSLPWPDRVKVHAWWQREAHRFRQGTRYFVGEVPSFEHCVEVLRTGRQRQRIAAAYTLCLLRPGTILFNTAAPAWRQQRLLMNLSRDLNTPQS